MNRPITDQEHAWLIRGLKTFETGEYEGGGNATDAKTGETLPPPEPIDPAPYLAQLDGLRVVGKCGCGQPNCHTIKFQHHGEGSSAAFVTHHTEDERLLIVFENDDGMLSELEII